jgi:hypothetical protein
MPFQNWNLKSDAFLREFLADSNGNPLTGATVGFVILKMPDGTSLATGNMVEQSGGYYRTPLDPAWAVVQGDLLKAELTAISAGGVQSYSELWIFVRIDND